MDANGRNLPDDSGFPPLADGAHPARYVVFAHAAGEKAGYARGLLQDPHPIYIFSLVFLTGLALLVRRPLLLALGVVIVPMQIVRARREAAVLEEKFGEEYRQYRARTWF